jgi:hypothetical protein
LEVENSHRQKNFLTQFMKSALLMMVLPSVDPKADGGFEKTAQVAQKCYGCSAHLALDASS